MVNGGRRRCAERQPILPEPAPIRLPKPTPIRPPSTAESTGPMELQLRRPGVSSTSHPPQP
jgi:hypothetical protein